MNEQPGVQIICAASSRAFSPDEQRLLERLRAEYREWRDLFSPHERARLRFVRWLYRAGRLAP